MLNTSMSIRIGRERTVPIDIAREETVGTLLYPEEFDFLHRVYTDPENDSPKFRFPDLISACVSIVFADHRNPQRRLIDYARSELMVRNSRGRPKCRSEDMWPEQYELLRAVQTSPDNRYPNPKFNLGDFTSACVALVMAGAEPQRRILTQARANLLNRVARK